MENILADLKGKFGGKILKVEEKSPRRTYCDVRPGEIPAMAGYLFKDLSCRFATASGVDTPAGMEILYHFSCDRDGEMITLRTVLTDKKQPAIESITPIIRGAEWIEREMWELLGINFKGHPNLKHLLLIEEWPEGEYPLRHDHEHKHEDDHES